MDPFSLVVRQRKSEGNGGNRVDLEEFSKQFCSQNLDDPLLLVNRLDHKI